MDTAGDFPGGKAAGERSWPFTSIHCLGQERWNYISIPPYVFTAWCLIIGPTSTFYHYVNPLPASTMLIPSEPDPNWPLQVAACSVTESIGYVGETTTTVLILVTVKNN
jgi:hypothetical protein